MSFFLPLWIPVCAGMTGVLNHDCHDFEMIAMMLPRPYIPLDSRLRENDGGLDVGIPLAPLRFAKGGGSSLRSE